MDMSCVPHLLETTALAKSGPDVFYWSEFAGRTEYSIRTLQGGHAWHASVAEEHAVAARTEALWAQQKSESTEAHTRCVTQIHRNIIMLVWPTTDGRQSGALRGDRY